jgi:hypothetical protein
MTTQNRLYMLEFAKLRSVADFPDQIWRGSVARLESLPDYVWRPGEVPVNEIGSSKDVELERPEADMLHSLFLRECPVYRKAFAIFGAGTQLALSACLFLVLFLALCM